MALDRFLVESSNGLLFSSSHLFVFWALLITALIFKQKLAFSTKFIVTIIVILVFETVFVFWYPFYFSFIGRLGMVFWVSQTLRNLLYPICCAIILYELVIGRLNLVNPKISQKGKIIQTIRLSFSGSVFQAFKYFFLLIISSITVIPLAWAIAATNRWLVSSSSTTDGTSNVTFNGKGTQVWGWFLGNWALFSLIYACSLLVILRTEEPKSFVALLTALFIMFFPLLTFFSYKILRWSVESIRIGEEVSPEFEGNFVSLMGFNLLMIVSALSIIGWAWVYAAFMRWICKNIAIKGYQIRFTGKGIGLLGVYLGVAIGSILIVTIPFMMIWSIKWHIEHIEIDLVEEEQPSVQ